MVVVVLAVVGYAGLVALTGVGARRRHASWPAGLAEGLVFPVTWVAWFVVDNRAAGRRWFAGH